jgi:hypothetical protein
MGISVRSKLTGSRIAAGAFAAAIALVGDGCSGTAGSSSEDGRISLWRQVSEHRTLPGRRLERYEARICRTRRTHCPTIRSRCRRPSDQGRRLDTTAGAGWIRLDDGRERSTLGRPPSDQDARRGWSSRCPRRRPPAWTGRRSWRLGREYGGMMKRRRRDQLRGSQGPRRGPALAMAVPVATRSGSSSAAP